MRFGIIGVFARAPRRLLVLAALCVGLSACSGGEETAEPASESAAPSRENAASNGAGSSATEIQPESADRMIDKDALPPITDPENTLVIKLKTGLVVVDLNEEGAPKHAERLKTLAREGFYDGIVFHRVIEGFMAQTGDPTGTGTGGSDRPDLQAEFGSTPFSRGVVGMARSSNPNSANSQFFITFADSNWLDGQYTVIGTVVAGMEHVDQIKRGEGQGGIVAEPRDEMIAVRVASDL